MQTMPNRSRVVGLVVRCEPAQNGWGAWVELQIQRAEPQIAAAKSWASSLVGKRERFFVPPKLMSVVSEGAQYDGMVTFRDGPAGGTWALVP